MSGGFFPPWCVSSAVRPPRHRGVHRAWRGTLLRMYWEGEETPAVEVPLGEFDDAERLAAEVCGGLGG